MITKERLKELIEQGTQVWKIYKDTCQGVYQVPAGLFGIGFSSQVDETTPFNELFETKEEAEWYKEFGCIERTERLELPTWEEMEIKFNKKQIIEMYFYYAKHFSAPKENNVEKTYSIYLLTNGHIVIDDNREVKTIFNEELTKENYTLACRKCKELFLGEKE